MADRRGARGRSRSRSRDRGAQNDGGRGRFARRAGAGLAGRGGRDRRGDDRAEDPSARNGPQKPTRQQQQQPRIPLQREQAPVDRTKTCPFLMRVFIGKRPGGGHRSAADYSGGRVPSSSSGDGKDKSKGSGSAGGEAMHEVHLYTWKDATLKELAGLIQEVEPEARHPRAVVSFAFVYPNRSGSMVVRQVGAVATQAAHPADDRTLGGCSFRPGDYLDVNISKAKPPRVGGRLRADGIVADADGGGRGGDGGGRGVRGDNRNGRGGGGGGGRGGGWGGRRVVVRR